MTNRAKKLNREEKLQLQAEKLKEQAQIDLEGYVMCRSALRATRTDLHEESERYDRLREEYEELKNRRAPYKVLFYKRRRIRKCKKHIKELGRAKKRLRKQMKEHRESVRRRTATNTFAFVAALAMFAMMAWRIWQLAQGVYYMAFYRNGEALEITAVAVLRQLLLVACIVYGLVVVWQSLQVWGMKREGWNGVIRIKVKQKAYWIMMIGVPLQIVSHGDMLTNAMMLITIISQMVMAALLSTVQSRRILVKIFAWCYVGGICVIWLYGGVYCRNFEISGNDSGTSTYAVDNKSNFSQIWEMSTEPEFYHMGMYAQNRDTDYGMMIIPGLAYADTIGSESRKIENCTSMTPQGLAVTKEYTFVSAYCKTKKHKSVIFVLDTQTGQYIKTLVLKDTTHAGGLAYDTKNNVLWVSSYMIDEDEDRSRKASISCLTLDSIEKYDVAQGKPIKYRNTCSVMFPATSFITIYDGHIYAGYWRKDKNSYSMAASYEIVNGGTAISSEEDEAFYIPGRVQGLQVYKNEIIFSISYGIDESRIEVYDTDTGKLSSVNYGTETPRQVVKLPQKLEQIYSYNGKLYCLFESASFAYRLTAPVCMDRIVGLDEMALVE